MAINKWRFPNEFLYDAHYQWIKRTDNKIVFGLTPYGVDITGDVLYLALPAVGTTVVCGGSCGSLEAGKWVGHIYAPASGTVTRVNEILPTHPALISQVPYECWFVEIELSQPEALVNLMSAAALQVWLAEDKKANA